MAVTLPSDPKFGQNATGGAPGLWANPAAVDGNRPPWVRAPKGATQWREVTANQQELIIKVKDDGRDDDWVVTEGIICERLVYTDFVDSGTTGTATLNGTIPVGAYLDKAQVQNVTAFDGDTTATIQISGGVDGADVDGYTTGTPSVFATADAVVVGVPSGVRTVTTAFIPEVVITSTADFTNVSADGALTVTLFYKV
jgi:hypothetical protein